MAVAVSNLKTNSVNINASFDEQEKRTLRKIADAGVGVIAVCTEQENGAATTTPAATNLKVNGLKAGRRYKIDLKALTSNATAAGGTRINLNLSGTQTTAVFVGDLFISSTVAFTTVTATGVTAVVAGTTALPSASVAINTNYGLGGTGGGGPVTFNMSGILIPQNDGDLVLQLASNVGSTQSRLEPGSVLSVQEVTF